MCNRFVSQMYQSVLLDNFRRAVQCHRWIQWPVSASQQRMPVRVVKQLKVTDAVSALVSNASDNNHHRSTLPGVPAPFHPLGQQHGQQPSTSTAAPSVVLVADALPQESGMKIGRQQALTGSVVPSIASLAEVHAPKNQRGMMTAVVRQHLPTSASASVIAAAGGSVFLATSVRQAR